MNITLKNVRLSFPALFEPKLMPGAKKAKYSACFILDKKRDAAQIKMIREGLATIAKESFKGKIPPDICLRPGDDPKKVDLDGYGPEVMFVSASSEKKIPVVDRNKTPLGPEDEKPYAGCYVNVVVRLWAQDNEFGKRINGQLRAVQFAKDGDPFGDKGVDPDEAFEDISGDDTDVKADDEDQSLL